MLEHIRDHKVTIIILCVVLVFLSVLAYQFVSVSGVFSGLKNDLKTIDPEVGDEYLDLQGNPVYLNDFKGKPLIINSWASWSPYSKEELPFLANIQDLHGDDLAVLAVNRKENPAIIKSYLDTITVDKNSILFVLDPTDHFYTASGGYAMPETIFYRKDGTIHTHVRGTLSEEVTTNIINDLLK